MPRAAATKIRLIFLILILASFLFLVERTGRLDFFKASFSYLAAPIQLSLYRTYQNFSQTLQAVTTIGSLNRENADLESTNAELQAENARLKLLEEENKTLREQLALDKESPKIKDEASVLGFGGSGSRSNLLINKGSQDRVEINDLVVVRDVYIGKIVEISPKTALVQLITDPNTRIPALTEKGALGILEGRFGTEAKITNVTQDDNLSEGDLVLATGEAGVPRGLVLGKIVMVNKVSRELFQDGLVESLIDKNKLKTVFIIEE